MCFCTCGIQKDSASGLTVVETPGLNNPNVSNNEIFEEIYKYFKQLKNLKDILIVVDSHVFRFTKRINFNFKYFIILFL